MASNSANANAYRITRIAQRYAVRSVSRLSHAINAAMQPTVRAKDHGVECETANDDRVTQKKKKKPAANNKRSSAVSQMATFHNIYKKQATVVIALLVSLCLRYLNAAAYNKCNNKAITNFIFGGFLFCTQLQVFIGVEWCSPISAKPRTQVKLDTFRVVSVGAVVRVLYGSTRRYMLVHISFQYRGICKYIYLCEGR